MATTPDLNASKTMEQRIESLEGNVSQILNLLKALKPPGKDAEIPSEEEIEKEEPEVEIVSSKDPQAKEANSYAGKVSEEEAKMMSKMEILEQKVRAMQGMESYGSLDMQSFYLFPDMEIPPKFKVPDFEKFEGRSDPVIHLTMYARSMAAYYQNEKLMIHCFQHSLTGGALNWFLHLDKNQTKTWRGLAELFVKQYQYVTDITPDRFELQRMKKAEKESFREYAQRWREKASQVYPPLSEKEIARVFVQTLEGPYFERLVGCVTNRFADIVIVGEQVEDAIREGKLNGANAQLDKQKKSMFQKKETKVHMVGTHHYPSHQPNYQPSSYAISFAKNAPTTQNQPYEPRKERPKIDPVPGTYSEIYDTLLKGNMIAPEVPQQVSNPPPKWYNPAENCKYHMGAPGHTIEKCWTFKNRVQKLRDAGYLNFEEKHTPLAGSSVENDPLMKH
ncbi:uncharacterized protein LOC130735472 [Lotus japonicus]|uniref:uncharacterized protein LOC130735472 n=1 Tax=Lotus japonicus TaxID=34305 RepID=UPI00259017BB|nr:uncharacterized protein LOC130735472 [Lotus japonicus]